MADDELFGHCVHCDGCMPSSPVHDEPCENETCPGSVPLPD